MIHPYPHPEHQLKIAVDAVKPLIRGMKCPCHKRVLRLRSVCFYYDETYLYAEIRVDCCHEFAVQVAEVIAEAKRIDKIYIIERHQKTIFR